MARGFNQTMHLAVGKVEGRKGMRAQAPGGVASEGSFAEYFPAPY